MHARSLQVWWVLLLAAAFFGMGCGLEAEGTYAPPKGEGGSAGSSGTAGAGGTGGATPGVESCLNGLDDDNDGKTDCEDSDCSPDYECIPDVPTGFTGNWVIDAAYPAQGMAPTCPDGSASLVQYVGPTSAQCTPCSCTYMGYTCTGPSVACAYDDGICSGISHTFAWPTQPCTSFPNPPNGSNNTGSCTILEGPKVAAQGACTGTASAIVNPNPWERQMYLCSTPPALGKGCGSGQVCAPKKSGEFASASTCVVAADSNASCPSGYTTVETIAYDDGQDMRACSACACDPNSVKCTGGNATVYDSNNCTAGGDGSVALPLDLTCISVANRIDNSSASLAVSFGKPTDGTCTQAVPSGSVMTIGPKKVCCQ